jgi:hypothetical protein
VVGQEELNSVLPLRNIIWIFVDLLTRLLAAAPLIFHATALGGGWVHVQHVVRRLPDPTARPHRRVSRLMPAAE